MGLIDDSLGLVQNLAGVLAPWKVLIVDDEPEVHQVTRLVLGNFRFDNRSLLLISAYSSTEAEAQLREHPDTAVILLDVVMETEQAGLQFVRTIRERLQNPFVRIVLRTGQPGQAPEHEVVAAYDINDYKEKTELTAQKLSTTLYAALRSYRDMRTIDASRRGLEEVIKASSEVFSRHQAQPFASTVLEKLSELIGVDGGPYCCRVTYPDGPLSGQFELVAVSGSLSGHVPGRSAEQLPAHLVQSMQRAASGKQHVFCDDHYVLHFSDSAASETLLYVGQSRQLDEHGHRLMQVFCNNVAIAHENLHLNRELSDSQLDMVYLLAGAAETRSRETANHVRRVGIIAAMLGRLHGLDERTCEMLNHAAPLHDIGKIGIPDSILNKPGAHTPEETVIMRTHAELGAKLLGGSRRLVFRLAGEIALTHHENFDGSGYPRGLSGHDIPIAGRITALADVFDALGSRRCYKEPWPDEEIRSFIRAQRSIKFDPELTDLLFANWDQIAALRRQLPDC